jgi:hypothetical protein
VPCCIQPVLYSLCERNVPASPCVCATPSCPPSLSFSASAAGERSALATSMPSDDERGDSLEVTFDLWMMANRAKFEDHGIWFHGQQWVDECSYCTACGCPQGMCPECLDP